MFYDRNVAAGRSEDAKRVLLIEGCSGSLFEYLHFDPSDISVYPLVEDSAEKCSPSLTGDAEGADSAFGVRLMLDHREEVYVFGVDLLEESVDSEGKPDIVRVYHA